MSLVRGRDDLLCGLNIVISNDLTDQILEVVWREARSAHQHQRVFVDEHDRDDVFRCVEGQILQQRDVRRNLQVVQQQRVAVGRRLYEAVSREDRAGAGDILDDEVLPSFFDRKFATTRAVSSVGPPAG